MSRRSSRSSSRSSSRFGSRRNSHTPVDVKKISSHEELLEVAETILYSVQLPAGVLKKYQNIRRTAMSNISNAESLGFSKSGPNSIERRMLTLTQKHTGLKSKYQSLRDAKDKLEKQVSELKEKNSQLLLQLEETTGEHKNTLEKLSDTTQKNLESAHARELESLRHQLENEFATERSKLKEQVAHVKDRNRQMLDHIQTIRNVYYEDLQMPLQASSQGYNVKSITTFFEKVRLMLSQQRGLKDQVLMLTTQGQQLESRCNDYGEYEAAVKKQMLKLTQDVSEHCKEWFEAEEELSQIRNAVLEKVKEQPV